MAPLSTGVCVVGDGTVRVDAAGDLDMTCGNQLRDVVRQALAAHAPKRVVVDLSRITFLDSAGIGALVGVLKEAREQGATLLVADPTPFVHHILDITGLLDAFGSPAPTASG